MSNSQRPSCRGTQQFLLRALVLCVCFLATTIATAAPEAMSVEVRSASLELNQDVYELDARIELQLPEEAREAIEAGLTMRLEYSIVLTRVRNFMLDAPVAELAQQFELSYHALSQRYLVRQLNTGEQQDFGTLQAALDRISEVRGLPVVDAALVDPDRQHNAGVQALVDLNTGSDALRWVLFWTDDWSVESEWFEWQLRP
jgi:hypothetical protein